MKKISEYKKYFVVLASIFIFGLFFYITYKTPLAGDDWGFYLNAQEKSPLTLAFEFYSAFSGRFFSEFWEHFGASHKWVWNFLNPTLFVIIFLCIYKFCKVKKYKVLCPLLIIAIILSVDDNLRMETYSWLTGEIYIIPLALSLVYFVYIDHIFFDQIKIKTNQKVVISLLSIICFYIGMTMENIAGVMIVAIILLIIYAYFNKREVIPYLLMNLFFSILGFVLMRSSPGSAVRMLRDHYEWSQLSLFEKIANGYPNFIEFTFINNNYLIMILSLVSCAVILTSNNYNVSKWIKALLIVLNIVGIVTVFSFVLPFNIEWILRPNSIYNMIFWPAYTIGILATLLLFLKGPRRDKSIFMFMLAGGANMAMMLSPIFGSRSSIYTVFFMICVILMMFETIIFNKSLMMIFMIMFIGICVDRTYEYLHKYHLVGEFQKERLSIIEYYRQNPDVEEVWIPRFPPYTIHGADIEPGDTYHFETFKYFYDIPQDKDKIFFYFKENGYE